MIDIPRLIAVAALWTGWCIQHSLLNDSGTLGAAISNIRGVRPYYRILYNVGAVITLVLVIHLTPRHGSVSIIKWAWPWIIVPGITMSVAIVAFALTLRQLDLSGFSGFKGLSDNDTQQAQSGGLVTDGIYGVIRHPQFSAGILALWSRDLADTDIVINMVLCLYMIIGARIEENRLMEQYGKEYRDYMERVPGFVPNRIPDWRNLIKASKIIQ